MSKVLVIDDSQPMVMSLKAMLERTGFEVETANDGVQGLARLDGGTPDVIVTDLNMPNMDGIEFIRNARSRPATRFTPILLLTTESQQQKRDEARAAGATGWIVKPVEPEQFVDVLRRVAPGS